MFFFDSHFFTLSHARAHVRSLCFPTCALSLNSLSLSQISLSLSLLSLRDKKTNQSSPGGTTSSLESTASSTSTVAISNSFSLERSSPSTLTLSAASHSAYSSLDARQLLHDSIAALRSATISASASCRSAASSSS